MNKQGCCPNLADRPNLPDFTLWHEQEHGINLLLEISILCYDIQYVRIQRGGDRGSGLPLKKHKNIGFLSNTGPDPLKITKLPSYHSVLGHHRYASETPLAGR